MPNAPFAPSHLAQALQGMQLLRSASVAQHSVDRQGGDSEAARAAQEQEKEAEAWGMSAAAQEGEEAAKQQQAGGSC